MYLKVFRNVFYECWNCAQPTYIGRVLILITLIHISLGNVLVSHNPSVYVPVVTKHA